jgi:hypothetical protein
LIIHASFCPLFSFTFPSELLELPAIIKPLSKVEFIDLATSKLDPPKDFSHKTSPFSVIFKIHRSAAPLFTDTSCSSLLVSPTII